MRVDLKRLGGKWNEKLRGGGGWIFPSRQQAALEELLQRPVSVDKQQRITDSAEVAEDAGVTQPSTEDAGVTQPSTEDAGVAAGLDITISQYSDKSVVVRGRGTYDMRVDLKRLGGKWNEKLRGGGGWIFPSRQQAALEELLQRPVSVDKQQRITDSAE